MDPKDIKKAREALNRIKADKESLERTLKEAKEAIASKEQELLDLSKVLSVIQEVADITLSNLKFFISGIVTKSIKAVDTEWPEYKVEFVSRRNRKECDIFFSEGGVDQHPLESSGGGAVNVASFGQLISYWTLCKNRATFVLDEPFRDVSPDRQSKVSDMLNEICTTLGIQIIMVSHAEDINIAADTTFLVTKKGFISEVTQL